MGARDAEPLLLSKLCDRGAKIQPKSSIDRVGTLMWNTGWHFECYHAISCLGLGTADLNYIISHAQDRMMFVDAHLIPLLEQVDAAVLGSLELFICVGENGEANQWSSQVLDPKRTVDYEAFLKSGNEEFSWPMVPETSLMGLCYTSGTTGRPKGAAYSQRSTYLHTLMICGVDQLAISAAEVVMPFVPMFHVLSWGIPYALLMTGAPVAFTNRFTDAGPRGPGGGEPRQRSQGSGWFFCM
eukprot:s66_g4.t1